MKTTDDELIRQLRAELDELVGGAHDVAGDPPPSQPNSAAGGDRDRRWVAVGIAAASVAVLVGALVVVANRDAGDAGSDTQPATSPTEPSTAPIITASTVPSAAPETSEVAPPATAEESSPPTTAPPIVQPPAEYEVITPVLETPNRGTQMCLGQWMVASVPPLCDGPSLEGWTWDAIEGEQVLGDSTWGEAYVAGTWDPDTQVFTVDEARAPTSGDHDRFAAWTPHPDISVPCPDPTGGWPARNQEWPEEQIHMIPGYAGSWEDHTRQVVTARFTGDLGAAEAAVRQYYGDALCVVAAQHNRDELVVIENQLRSMSSFKFIWSALYADATGEWLEVGVITADPDRQAAFDQQYGEGVVRLTPRLRPL